MTPCPRGIKTLGDLRHREKLLPADHRDPANDKLRLGTRLALCEAFADPAPVKGIESSKNAEIPRLVS
jgi:hypothetical protein